MKSGEPFDDYTDTYGDAVDEAIAFTHQGHEFFTRSKVRHLLRVVDVHVGPPERHRVLDLGCGPGVTDGHLAPHFADLSGVDVSTGMIARASAANPGVDYRTYDGRELPWPDDTFDVTFTICVLHHVPPDQWQGFMSEMARVTRPGGLAVVFEHNPWNPLTRRAVSTCEFDDGVTLLSRRTTQRLARNAGLREVESRYIMFLPFGDAVSDRTDHALGWLPLGGQYLVAARVPDSRS